MPRARGALRPSALPGVTWPVRWQGETPLFMAASEGHADIAVTLIDHKADVNLAPTSGYYEVSLARPACREPLGAWRWCRAGGGSEGAGARASPLLPCGPLEDGSIYVWYAPWGGTPPPSKASRLIVTNVIYCLNPWGPSSAPGKALK